MGAGGNQPPGNSRTVAEAILDRFSAWGIKTLFVIPGVQIEGLLMQAARDDRFRIVMAAHEQGAGYMADGFARISGGPGVVITINGPGANNLTTAAVTARVDRSPVLFLTGDAPAIIQGFGGFQCSDPEASNSTAILREALGNSFCITTPQILSDAFQFFEELLISPSPGPMHINLPSDIAKQPIVGGTNRVLVIPPKDKGRPNKPNWLGKIPPSPGSRAAVLVGEEVKEAAEMAKIAEFSRMFAIPVAYTLAAKNIQPLLSEGLSLGVFGFAGGPRAFEAILDPQLETLIVLGAVLDERNSAAWHPDFFHPTRNILRFSTDRGTVRKCPVPITEVFERTPTAIHWLQNHWGEIKDSHPVEYRNRLAWNKKLQNTSRIPRCDLESHLDSGSEMSMAAVVSMINGSLPAETTLFLDSGDHRIHGGTFWDVGACHSFFTAAQTAPMGWAVGAAVGASFAKENRQIWVITGDGCMLMHGMEISVAAKYKRRVVFLVSNNGSYGRVAARMIGEPETLRQTLTSLPVISWTDFGRSLGVPSRRASNIQELTAAVREAQDSDGPFLIEVITSYKAACPYPPAVFSSSSPGFVESWRMQKPQRTKPKEMPYV